MKTVGGVIGDALNGGKSTWSSIKLLSGPENIQDSSCSLIQEGTEGLYATIFLVLMNDGAWFLSPLNGTL